MKKTKILIFEYIIGGGLNKSALPNALAREGLLMLQTIIDDLSKLEHSIEPMIMLDWRVVEKVSCHSCSIFIIKSEHDSHQEFVRLISTCDAVWPIAPESDGILQSLCEAVEQTGKVLLTSPAHAVAIAGNKWLTYQCLLQHSIATPHTCLLKGFSYDAGEWIIKSVDGVGCEDSYLIDSQDEFAKVTSGINQDNYLIQVHLQGEKISLSCLFKDGHGWLVCANKQQFVVIDKRYHLTEITVNFTSDLSKYQALVQEVAVAMPTLWGYVGIDLIETADQIFVLEINPRLTTSYAGIDQALGVNCVRAALELWSGEPQLQPIHNQPVHLNING